MSDEECACPRRRGQRRLVEYNDDEKGDDCMDEGRSCLRRGSSMSLRLRFFDGRRLV